MFCSTFPQAAFRTSSGNVWAKGKSKNGDLLATNDWGPHQGQQRIELSLGPAAWGLQHPGASLTTVQMEQGLVRAFFFGKVSLAGWLHRAGIPSSLPCFLFLSLHC